MTLGWPSPSVPLLPHVSVLGDAAVSFWIQVRGWRLWRAVGHWAPELPACREEQHLLKGMGFLYENALEFGSANGAQPYEYAKNH